MFLESQSLRAPGRIGFSLLSACCFLGASIAPISYCLAQSAPPVVQSQPLHDVPYVSGGHERQKLDIYLPQDGTARPALVWIHGGAWEAGSKERCPAVGMVAQGFVVVSLNYRLSQHAVYPAQIEDCKSAIRWLRTHAAEYGIDPERIGVWGASAGGHLAALLGVTGHTREFDKGENLNESSRVQCVLEWFGPTDFLHWGAQAPADREKAELADNPSSPVYRLLGGSVREHGTQARLASPIYFIQKDASPFLIMHGDKDPLVPLQQSTELDQALKACGVECRLDVVADAGHGGGGFSTPERLKGMVSFLKTHLAPIPKPN
ncbi:MAG: peptidase prolyl oligopeptidase active site domain protein [Chthoniobacteraceae bacterium]|nr:peptidase prolyl oligopeptidase active site domain protein [Chthoniobacteraceae bacterium]